MIVTAQNLREVIANNDTESIIQTLDPFLKRHAFGIAKNLSMSHVIDVDDLYQTGVEGVLRAVGKFSFLKDDDNFNFGNFISP